MTVTVQHPTENLVRLWCAPIGYRAQTQVAVDGDAERAEPAATGNGSTLFGHFAVFDRWTEIDSWFEGRFLEKIARGAFKDTFVSRGKQVRVLYDHGHDPQIGNKPLGTPDVMREDKTGAYYEVGLFDAPYVDQLRPALAAGQMGASFRFSVRGEEWYDPTEPSDWNPLMLPERTISAVDLYEFGPVTFPAYQDATAGLRSRTDEFVDRLAADPAFVARFIERVGPNIAAQVLAATQRATPTSTAADGPVNTPPSAADGPGKAAHGRLVSSARAHLLSLR